jgi:hypothetical protein
VNHKATPEFWACYRGLPLEIQRLADNCFQLLQQNPRHPSLRFKYVGTMRSVRVGLPYRALAVERGNDVVWFWIGSHAEYDQLLGR